MRGLITSLIVLGVVVMVGGLGVCLVGRARDAARKQACKNNLKQIALALHGYQDTHGSFPMATVPHPTLPPERRLSWMPDILPFSKSTRQLLFDRNEAWDADPNRDPMFRALDRKTKDAVADDPPERFGLYLLFLCPANSERERPGQAAFTHHVGVAGVGANAAMLPLVDPKVGFFGHDRVTRKSDVTDGLEYSILLAETATANGPWTAGGYPTVRGTDPSNPPPVGRGAPFSSRHLNSVVNVAMGDGTVRSITTEVAPEVLDALTTIHGGEVWPFQ